MALDHTIALARDVLAEGRADDVVCMVEPLLCDAGPGAERAALAALLARVETVEYGRPREALRHLAPWADRAAREALPPATRAEMCLTLGWAHAWHDVETHDDARALALLDEADVTFAERCDAAGRAWAALGAALAYATVDEYRLMRRALDDAARLLASADDAPARRWLAELRVVEAHTRGDLNELADALDAMTAASHPSSSTAVLGRIAACRAALLDVRGADADHVAASAEEAEMLLTGAGVPPSFPLLVAYRSHFAALLRAGRWDELARRADEAERYVRDLPAAGAHLRLPTLLADARRGRVDAARDALAALRADAHPVRHRLLALRSDLCAARLHLHAKEPTLAREAAARAGRLAEETGHAALALEALLLEVRAALALGDVEPARARAAAVDPWTPAAMLPALAALRFETGAALALADGAEARARPLLQQAALAYRIDGDRYGAARCRLDLGRLEREHNPSLGRFLIEEAETAFRGVDATPALEEARAALRGGPVARASQGWPEAVTLGERLALPGQSEALLAETLLDAVGGALESGAWAALVHQGGPERRVVRASGLADDTLDEHSDDDGVRRFAFGDGGDGYVLMIAPTDDRTWGRLVRQLEAVAPAACLALAHARRVRSRTAPPVALGRVGRLRHARLPVLLAGETGTDLDGVAHTLHSGDGPFIALDCREADAVDHALFGHEAAGLPGAVQRAHGGLLYLAHVDALPHPLQPRLLRVLEEGEVLPVGASEARRVRLRLVAGSHADLAAAVRDGAFDERLYHRLRAGRLTVPPLRERRDELPALARRLLSELRPAGVPPVHLTAEALDALLAYDWPGNDRQLRNEMERALQCVLDEPLPTVGAADLSDHIRFAHYGLADAAARSVLVEHLPLDQVLADVERQVLARTLAAHDGQVSAAAETLGLTRQGLYKKIKRLGIDPSATPSGDGATRDAAAFR